MRSASLPASAYVVLGLLDAYGACTPYDLTRWLENSVGYFWSFPRAQLYVEPQRLAELGLVQEVREPSGRRRRRFTIAPTGRQALRDWISSAESATPELRDPGLLKLFFARVVDTSSVVALARTHAAQHAQRLTTYQHLVSVLQSDPDAAFALATLRLGLRHEQIAVDFWQEVADRPPRAPTPGPRRGRRSTPGVTTEQRVSPRGGGAKTSGTRRANDSAGWGAGAESEAS